MEGPAPYRGIAWSWAGATTPNRRTNALLRAGWALDLPVSLVLDTVLLPASTTYWLLAKADCVEYRDDFIGGGG